ncbi:potassium-transporting ATPase subunit C [Actinoplanes regularis]|uniref:Potassium-transporting ATPase KdpC subunit n=1 Tax=Actinoplanes regularis TaxID=52697 RepID=A0A239FC12_9ACTN|nr:potassium-transporting ATPase subunit C [Actinoplanes regularis]GIE89534.1 potassium-transporting ATPase KdpC subunit [Actinoplanes regularis]SNS54590.1 K+-transporting ATPase ATPase C chain [Actinoplanes regularis]
MRLPGWLAQHLAALRALLVLTVLTGVLYPLAVTAAARLPGLRHHADGSLVRSGDTTVASALIGQSFTGPDGAPLVQYFQSRPSAAGYDPTATGASNLGPESVVDTAADRPSLLTQVCARSNAIGAREGVDGRRPYCTPQGVGAVLAVFRRDGLTGPVTRVVSVNEACPATPFQATYQGITVRCAAAGEDYSAGVVTPVRGDAPAHPAVPADAVTAGGSGLDPGISPAYADLQVARIARARGIDPATLRRLVAAHTTGRALGFLGAPAVNVTGLNADLDTTYPFHD